MSGPFALFHLLAALLPNRDTGRMQSKISRHAAPGRGQTTSL